MEKKTIGIIMNGVTGRMGYRQHLVRSILAIRDQILPPTVHLNSPDPECALDYIPNVPRRAKVDVCMSNSMGFGGQNDSLIIRRAE